MREYFCVEGKLNMGRSVMSLLLLYFLLSKCYINAQVFNKISLEGSPYSVLEINSDRHHYILYNRQETVEVKNGNLQKLGLKITNTSGSYSEIKWLSNESEPNKIYIVSQDRIDEYVFPKSEIKISNILCCKLACKNRDLFYMSDDSTIFLLDLNKKRLHTFKNKKKPQSSSELFFILSDNSESQRKQKYIYSLDGDLLGEFYFDSNTFKNYNMNDYYYLEHDSEKKLIEIFNTKGEKQTIKGNSFEIHRNYILIKENDIKWKVFYKNQALGYLPFNSIDITPWTDSTILITEKYKEYQVFKTYNLATKKIFTDTISFKFYESHFNNDSDVIFINDVASKQKIFNKKTNKISEIVNADNAKFIDDSLIFYTNFYKDGIIHTNGHILWQQKSQDISEIQQLKIKGKIIYKAASLDSILLLNDKGIPFAKYHQNDDEFDYEVNIPNGGQIPLKALTQDSPNNPFKDELWIAQISNLKFASKILYSSKTKQNLIENYNIVELINNKKYYIYNQEQHFFFEIKE